MSESELRAEIIRLHALILNLAYRLAAASEVLTMLAEKKERRNAELEHYV